MQLCKWSMDKHAKAFEIEEEEWLVAYDIKMVQRIATRKNMVSEIRRACLAATVYRI